MEINSSQTDHLGWKILIVLSKADVPLKTIEIMDVGLLLNRAKVIAKLQEFVKNGWVVAIGGDDSGKGHGYLWHLEKNVSLVDLKKQRYCVTIQQQLRQMEKDIARLKTEAQLASTRNDDDRVIDEFNKMEDAFWIFNKRLGNFDF